MLQEGQEIIVGPDLFSKRRRKATVFGFSQLGGWCRGTGKEITREDRLVFVNFDKRKNPLIGVENVTYYSYAESFLTAK